MRAYNKGLVPVIIITILLSSLGCGSKPKDVGVSAGSVMSEAAKEALASQALDADVRKIIESSAVSDIPLTSYEKIDQAYSGGKIAKDSEVALKILSVFDPDRLPGEYQGTSINGFVELNSELQWVINNLKSLPAEKKKLLEPFVLAPDNPMSFFNPRNKGKQNDFTKSLLSLARAEAADEDSWPYVVFSVPGKPEAARIYYNITDGMSQADKDAALRRVNWVKQALQDSWGKFKGMLGIEPAKMIKIYLTELPDNVYGLALWYSDTDQCRINLSSSAMEKYLKCATVHELFHAYQYSLGLTFGDVSKDLMWLGDATAVWSESYIYPLYNREHEVLNAYISNLHNELVVSNENKEYGSYLLFYFLHQYTGETKVIADILKGAAGTNIRGTVMNKINNYAAAFADFALYNWNQGSYYRAYQDTPNYPDIFPHGKSVEARYEKGPKDENITTNLDKGAIKYIVHTFVPDIDKVKRVKFTFDAKNTDPHLRRQALIKTGEAWYLEPWNEITEREFDRRKPEENIKAVIVIFSNADLTSKKEQVKYNLKIDNSDRYKGYVKWTAKITTPTSSGNAVFTSKDILTYNKDKNAYVVKERKMNYNSNTRAGTASIQARGSLTENYSPQEAPVRLEVDSSGEVTVRVDPPRRNKTWITEVWKSGFGTWTKQIDLEGAWWLSGIPIPKGDVTKKMIKGSQNMNVSQPGGQVIFMIEYYFELD
jgi:hypothetical protein